MLATALRSAGRSAPTEPSGRPQIVVRTHRLWWGLLLALITTVVAPASAWAGPGDKKPAPAAAPRPADKPKEEDGPSPEARAANQKALELVKDGNYAEALRYFQEAYDKSAAPLILYNIGRMSRYTQDFARALTAFKRYMTDGAPDIDTARRSEVEQEITSLTSLVGWVTIKTEAGATVSIDDREIGAAPINEKLPVNPGARTFKAVKPTGEKVSKDVPMKAGDAIEVDLDFDKKVDGSNKKPPPGDPFRFPSGLTVAAWVATGAFTSATIVTGVLAITTSNDLSDDTYVGPARAPDRDSDIAGKAKRVDALSTATNVLLGAAIVSGTTAIAFSIVDAVAAGPEPKTPAAQKKPPEKPASLQVRVGVGSLSLSGTF